MNPELLNTRIHAVTTVLRMEHDSLSPYYSFPLFVPDYELHIRKIPSISFMYNGALVTDPVQLNHSGKELVRQAFGALREQKLAWQSIKDETGSALLLYAQPKSGVDETVAEKILDPIFMEEACAILRSHTLDIALPHSRIIIACAQTATPEPAFLRKIQEESSKVQVALLTDLIFTYSTDRITAVREPMPEQQESKASSLPVATGDQLLNITEVPVFTGDFFYKVEIGAPDETQLLDLCEQTLFHLLKNSIALHRFLGIIEFVLNRNINPYSTTLDDKLSQFWNLLEKSKPIKELGNQLRRNMELSICFGEHMANGESHLKKHFKITFQR